MENNDKQDDGLGSSTHFAWMAIAAVVFFVGSMAFSSIEAIINSF